MQSYFPNSAYFGVSSYSLSSLCPTDWYLGMIQELHATFRQDNKLKLG